MSLQYYLQKCTTLWVIFPCLSIQYIEAYYMCHQYIISSKVHLLLLVEWSCSNLWDPKWIYFIGVAKTLHPRLSVTMKLIVSYSLPPAQGQTNRGLHNIQRYDVTWKLISPAHPYVNTFKLIHQPLYQRKSRWWFYSWHLTWGICLAFILTPWRSFNNSVSFCESLSYRSLPCHFNCFAF